MQNTIRNSFFIAILILSLVTFSMGCSGDIDSDTPDLSGDNGDTGGNGDSGDTDDTGGLDTSSISGAGALDWEEAIAFCEDLELAGYDDWRLPNVKELHSLLDYSRSPDYTDSAAIDPLFNATEIINEEGAADYPYYWSSTTHMSGNGGGESAAYIAFGRGLGYMSSLVDAHGAGSQRSDAKSGNRDELPTTHGPQGDIIRVYNYVRCVRGDGLNASGTYAYPIVDTNANRDWTDTFGEDADYDGNQPSYTDNGNGTITDNVTGLIWQQDPGANVTFTEAGDGASSYSPDGNTDWRFPSIKELYSLILFSGEDATGCATTDSCNTEKFIDENYFVQAYGDTDAGERVIDAQTWSATEYVWTTMQDDDTVFGVNFVDGRIKGYPRIDPFTAGDNDLYCRYVRGNLSYGVNDFVDNGDGTITDNATGLMWTRDDSGGLNAD